MGEAHDCTDCLLSLVSEGNTPHTHAFLVPFCVEAGPGKWLPDRAVATSLMLLLLHRGVV